MKKELLNFLCCPECEGNIIINKIAIENKGNIITGLLACNKCSLTWPIRNAIPRFVEKNYYAGSFGKQWKTFAKTQLDNDKIKESETRFKSELGWNANELKGKTVLEFGSGAGRFVDVVSRAGAKLIVGVDVTDAVDASQDNLSSRNNVSFIQADLFHLPIRKNSFDYVYSIGVLHHTPDPKAAFNKMIETTKVDGSIGLSLYEISLYNRPNRNTLWVSTKELFWALNMWRCELFRNLTTRLPQSLFLVYCKTAIPILHIINKIPVLRYIRYFFPSTCYKTLPVAWSMLDTYDTYATKIVHQYRGKDIFHWFLSEGMDRIILHNGRAGWVSVTGIKRSDEERKKLKIAESQPSDIGSR